MSRSGMSIGYVLTFPTLATRLLVARAYYNTTQRMPIVQCQDIDIQRTSLGRKTLVGDSVRSFCSKGEFLAGMCQKWPILLDNVALVQTQNCQVDLTHAP